MRVNLDVDGVLVSFVEGVCRSLKDRAGLDIDPSSFKQFDIFDELPKDTKHHVYKDIESDWWCESLPPFTGAQDFIRKLAAKDHEIKLVTSSWIGCRTWEAQRRKAMQKLFKIKPQQITFTSEKADVRGDCFIEDKAENLRPWLKCNEGRLGILKAQSYNATGNDDLLRLDSYEEILEVIEKHEEKLK